MHHRFCTIVLLAALAIAAAGCAGNTASQSGWYDHNLDLPYWEE